MRDLSLTQTQEVGGGFLNFVFGTIIGLASYAINKKSRDEPITIPGATTAAGFGAVTGGIGGAAIRAAGGGIVGNFAWRPGVMAINAAGQAIAAEK